MRALPGVPPMKPEDISARHWDAYAAAGENPQWTQHPLIEAAVYRRITGGDEQVLAQLAARGRARRPVRARAVARLRHRAATSSSSRARARSRASTRSTSRRSRSRSRAKTRARTRASTTSISSRPDSTISTPSSATRRSTSSASSARCITSARSTRCSAPFIAGCLTPDGKLVFNEYTGDCYTILDERKVATINRPPRDAGPGVPQSRPAALRQPDARRDARGRPVGRRSRGADPAVPAPPLRDRAPAAVRRRGAAHALPRASTRRR